MGRSPDRLNFRPQDLRFGRRVFLWPIAGVLLAFDASG